MVVFLFSRLTVQTCSYVAEVLNYKGACVCEDKIYTISDILKANVQFLCGIQCRVNDPVIRVNNYLIISFVIFKL